MWLSTIYYGKYMLRVLLLIRENCLRSGRLFASMCIIFILFWFEHRYYRRTTSILIKSINQIILFPVCVKLYSTANIGKVVSSKHTRTIGFLFVASKRTIFLSLVKLPSVIKIHSETTRPHSTLKIQVRPGVLTGCPLVYNGSTFLRLCDHSPRGVPFSFFFFFSFLSFYEPPWRNSVIRNHRLFSSGRTWCKLYRCAIQIKCQ